MDWWVTTGKDPPFQYNYFLCLWEMDGTGGFFSITKIPSSKFMSGSNLRLCGANADVAWRTFTWKGWLNLVTRWCMLWYWRETGKKLRLIDIERDWWNDDNWGIFIATSKVWAVTFACNFSLFLAIITFMSFRVRLEPKTIVVSCEIICWRRNRWTTLLWLTHLFLGKWRFMKEFWSRRDFSMRSIIGDIFVH